MSADQPEAHAWLSGPQATLSRMREDTDKTPVFLGFMVALDLVFLVTGLILLLLGATWPGTVGLLMGVGGLAYAALLIFVYRRARRGTTDPAEPSSSADTP